MKYKDNYKLLFEKVSTILFNYDPVGLVALEVPRNEYDPEVSIILPNLFKCKDLEEVRDVVQQVFVSQYGEEYVKGKEEYQVIAKEIWEAYKKFQGED